MKDLLGFVELTLFDKGAHQMNQRNMSDIGIPAFRIYILECLYGVYKIASVQPGQSNLDIIVIDPTAVGVTLNRNRSHLNNFVSILGVGFGQRGVQFWKEPEDLVVVIIQTLEDDFFHLSRLFKGVIVAVVMRSQVVVNGRRDGILF